MLRMKRESTVRERKRKREGRVRLIYFPEFFILNGSLKKLNLRN